MLYVPVVLRYLGTDLYGIWATVLNVLSWINYFDVGIGNGLRNKLSACLASGKPDSEAKGLISSAYFLLGMVMAVVCVASTIIFQFINWAAVLNVPTSLYDHVGMIVTVSFLLMCVSFLFSIVKSMYFAIQQAHIVSLIGVMQQILMLVSVLLLSLLQGDKLSYVAWTYGFAAIIVQVVFTILFFVRNRSLAPGFKYVNRDHAFSVTGLGLQFFVVQIASLVLFSTSNIIVSNLFGPSAVTPFTTVNKLFTVVTSLFAAFVSPYWSSITASAARGDSSSIRRSISRMRIYVVVPLLMSLVLYLLIDWVLFIWLGQSLVMPVGLKEIMFVYTVVYLINTIYSQAANGLSLMKMMIWVALLQAIVNIPLSFFFGNMLGSSTGVMLGTVITMSTSLIVYPVAVNKAISNLSR